MKRTTAAQRGIGTMAVLIFAANAFVLSQRNVSTAVPLEQVLADFRAGDPQAPVDAVTESPTAPRSAAKPTTEVTAPAITAPTTVAPTHQPKPSAPASKAVSAPTPPQLAALHRRPVEGVYTYRTTGGESISVAGASHDYPERTYATIRHLGDGCEWHYRNDVIEEHVDERRLCTAGGVNLQHLQAREVEFFGQRDRFDITCDPPQVLHRHDDVDGRSTVADCRGGGADVRMTRTLLGTETLVIGGEPVEVVHFAIDSVMTGSVDGDAHDEHWVDVRTGMSIRWERTVDTVADAAFGARVRYQEQATFELESLTPRT